MSNLKFLFENLDRIELFLLAISIIGLGFIIGLTYIWFL